MAIFMLIHGAWHGGWCWERLVPALEGRGHTVIAPDLPAMGSDATPLGEVSLESWAEHVAALIRRQTEPVILVGHSRGGIVISQTAELVPERVSALVYLAAFLIPDGKTMREGGSRSGSDNPPPGLTLHEDGSISMAAATARAKLYNGTASEFADAAVARLCPEPGCMFRTPLRLSDARFGQVPRAYIETTLDLALPVERQRAMQAVLPCEPVITLEADHSPFYSRIEPLVDALDGIAGHYGV